MASEVARLEEFVPFCRIRIAKLLSHPDRYQANHQSRKHAGRYFFLVVADDVCLILAFDQAQTFQGFSVRVEDPIIWYSELAIPFTLGSVVVEFVAGTDRFDHEFWNDPQPAIAKLRSCFSPRLGFFLFSQLFGGEKYSIDFWNTDVVYDQIHFESKFAGFARLLEIFVHLMDEPLQWEASFKICSRHFGQHPLDDFVSAPFPQPFDPRIIKIVFRPSGRPGNESARMRRLNRHGMNYPSRHITLQLSQFAVEDIRRPKSPVETRK
jgi:hypothetical protein